VLLAGPCLLQQVQGTGGCWAGSMTHPVKCTVTHQQAVLLISQLNTCSHQDHLQLLCGRSKPTSQYLLLRLRSSRQSGKNLLLKLVRWKNTGRPISRCRGFLLVASMSSTRLLSADRDPEVAASICCPAPPPIHPAVADCHPGPARRSILLGSVAELLDAIALAMAAASVMGGKLCTMPR